MDDDLQAQGTQRLQDLADLGRFLAPFKLRQEARAQVAEPGDRFQRQASVLAMGARQATEFLNRLDFAVWDVILRHRCTPNLGAEQCGNVSLVGECPYWSSGPTWRQALKSGVDILFGVDFRAMDLIELLKRPEGKTLEFKRDLSSPDGVLRAIVAFANTAEGVLLLGEVVKFHGKHKISDDLNRNPEIHRSIGAILPCYDDGAKRDQGTT